MNTALQRSLVLYLRNNSGANLNFGDTVVLDINNPDSFTTINEFENKNRLKGVIVDSGGIENGKFGMVCFYGYCPRVNLLAVANIGNKIVTSNVAGKSTVGNDGFFGIAMSSGTSPNAYLMGFDGNLTYVDAIGGRLTAFPGDSNPTGTVITTGVIYYTPHLHNIIGLYHSGTNSWDLYRFSETAINISSLASGTVHDIYAYLSGSSVAFQTVAWSDANNRGFTIVKNNIGIWIRDGQPERRYIGTIRMFNNGILHDSPERRHIYNEYNKLKKLLRRRETAASWTYSTDNWRIANNNTNNVVSMVNGREIFIDLELHSLVQSASGAGSVGIGINSNSVDSSNYKMGPYIGGNSDAVPAYAGIRETLRLLGNLVFSWLERANGNITFYQNSPSIDYRDAGFVGFVEI